MTSKTHSAFHGWSWIFLFLILVGLACNLPAVLQSRLTKPTATPTTTPTPTATPRPLPPAVIETEPEEGRQVPLLGTVTFYFNQHMDRETVEQAFHTEPEIPGRLRWEDDSTVVFVPDRALAPSSTLSLQLDETAKAANGLSFLSPVQVDFTTPKHLQATHFLPAPGGTEIDPASSIMVTFNQPVVPLGRDGKDLLPAFNLSPSVPGSGEWINTSTFVYRPAPALAGGETYTIQLNPDITSSSGAPLAESTKTSWSFSTQSPKLLEFAPPSSSQGMPLDADIELTFNQAMDPESVRTHFALRDSQGRKIQGEFQWSEDARSVSFRPLFTLDRKRTYTVFLPAETESAGGTPLGAEHSWQFHTVGQLKLLSSNPREGFATRVYQGILLYFNSPVQREDLEDKIHLTPEISNMRISWVEADNALRITGDFAALENYTLRVDESLSDVWGSSLSSPILINFSTRALSPNFVITQGTHDLFMTAEENVIPAQGTNLSSVLVSLGTIPADRYPEVLGPERYQALKNFNPADDRTWRHAVNLPGDTSHRFNLPVSPDGSPLSPGLYRFQVSSSQLPYNPAPFLLAVSHNHLSLKLSPNDVLAWAVDLRSGEPIDGTPIRVFDQGGQVVFQGETDAQGMFFGQFKAPHNLYQESYYAILGQLGEDSFAVTSSTWQQGSAPYLFGLSADYAPERSKTYIYTDRPIYRPGQTVYYRVIERDRKGTGYSLPGKGRAEGKVLGPEGELASFDLPMSPFGTAHGQYTLSEFAEPGYYRLESGEGLVTFQVAEYRKPEIDLEVELSPQTALSGELLQASVEARYYFDAPVGKTELDWSLSARHTPFILPGYQVGSLEDRWFGFPSSMAEGNFQVGVEAGEGQTSRNGTWTTEFAVPEEPLPETGISLPATYILETTMADESGFPVSARDEATVHPSQFYIGVNSGKWISKAKQETNFEVKVVDWDKLPDGIRELQADFKKVTWERTGEDPYRIRYQRKYEPVESLTFQTDTGGTAEVVFVPPEPGAYQLDVHGEGARTEILVWVSGPGGTTWPAVGNQRLNLVADKEAYRPGERAEVFIPNPFPKGGKALVTLEREQILYSSVVTIEGSGKTLSLPLSREEVPNAYLSVTLLGKDAEGHPDFRQGYLNLPVDPLREVLFVELVGDPQRTEPGGDVEITLRVKDSQGQPVEGEFSLAVVDEAVLALADPNAVDIREAFFGRRPLGVRLGLPLGLHAGREVLAPGGIGGGGGGGSLVAPVRSQFPDTLYWNPEIITDDEGVARVTLPLPDHLTTWRLQVRGITKDSKVGQAESGVITSKDLLVRPVTPRFLVAGDHLGFAAIVHNNTGGELEAQVSMQSRGLALDDPSKGSQTVIVPPEGRKRVEWWARVKEVEAAEIVFSAQAGDLVDRVQPQQGVLPVLQYTAPKTYSTAGVMDSHGTRLEVVDLPRTFDPNTGSLNLEISPSLAAAVIRSLDAMEDDQKSTVSTVSHFLPNLAVYRALRASGLERPEFQSRLDESVPASVEKIQSLQNEDGGWGWWVEDESDRSLTSYILFGLTQAQKAGMFVENEVIQGAKEYLLASLPSTDMLTRSWQFDQLVFQYFALSEAGVEELAGAGHLYEYRTSLAPWARALLALTLETQNPGDPRVDTLFSDLEAEAILSAAGAHWEEEDDCICRLHSTGTTTAIATYALVRHDPQAESIPSAVRYLITARTGDGSWHSDYETAWSVLALARVLEATEEVEADYMYSASVNGREIISGRARGPSLLSAVEATEPVEELRADRSNALEIKRSAGEGPLYYQAHLSVSRPAVDVAPYGNGMSLSRVYSYDEGEEELTFTRHASTTELITVHLTLSVEEDMYYLKIKDTIPSGAEILDTRLKTTQQGEASFNVSTPFREGWGWWHFNTPQVYDDHIIWSSEFLPEGTYELTYTLALNVPGEYQVLPAHAWQVYFPDVQAISAGDKFVITD